MVGPHRRRHQPLNSQPSASALVAAAAVYRPSPTASSSSLAAAAAGAALRNVSVSPPPPEQRIGSIPTKRMLKRQESYSSATSDGSSVHGGVLISRHGSSSSLGERAFRRERSASRIMERPPVEEEEEEELELDSRSQSPDIARTSHSLPSTLRGQSAPLRRKRGDRTLKQEQPRESVLSRGSLRDSAPRRSASIASSISSAAAGRSLRTPSLRASALSYPGKTSSVASFTSDLDSVTESVPQRQRNIAPPPRRSSPSPPRMQRIHAPLIEDSDSEFVFSDDEESLPPPRAPVRKQRPPSPPPPPKSTTPIPPPPPLEQRSRPHSMTVSSLNPKPSTPLPRSASVASSRKSASPSRAHFGGATTATVRHSPPPRSVSPAKPALKHNYNRPGSPVLNGAIKVTQDTLSSPSSTASDTRKRTARVSFSEEDSVASFTDPPPTIISADGLDRSDPLPVFGSVRRARDSPEDESHYSRKPGFRGSTFDTSAPGGTRISQDSYDSDFTSSDESDGGIRHQPATKAPDTRGVAVNGASKGRERRLEPSPHIPELNLIQPTPQEEKPEPVPAQRFTGKYLSPDYIPPPFSTSSHGEQASESYQNPAESSHYQTVPSHLNPLASGPITLPGAFPAPAPPSESDSDSSDNDSIYSDAFEILPSEPHTSRLAASPPPNLPPIAETSSPKLTPGPPSPTPMSSPPASPTGIAKTLPSGILRPPSPPLPPNFSEPTPTPPRRRSATPPPRHRRSNSYQAASRAAAATKPIKAPEPVRPPTATQRRDSDVSLSSLSDSSFQRTNPGRKRFTGLRSSMRTEQPLPPPRTLQRRFSSDSSGGELGSRGGVRLGLGWPRRKRASQPLPAPWSSRFEDSSDDEPTPLPRSSLRTQPHTSSILPASSAVSNVPPPTARNTTRPPSILRRISTGASAASASIDSRSTPPTHVTPLLPPERQVNPAPTNPARPANRLQKRKTSGATSNGTHATPAPIIVRSSTPVRVRSPVSGAPIQRARTPANRTRTPLSARAAADAGQGAIANGKKDLDTVPIRPVKTKRRWWGGKKKVPVVFDGEVDDVTKIGPIADDGAVDGAPAVAAKMESETAAAAAVVPERKEKAKKGKGWKRLMRKWK